MSLTVIDGTALTEDEIVAEAYGHVAEGYRRALDVPGLPAIELDALRTCLRSANAIARNPQLYPLGIDDPTRGGL
jgi:hypothetical protein